VQRGASIAPTKDPIDWPYVVLLVGLVVIIAAAVHLLSAWAAYVILVFVMWSKARR
jgi:hypothetical protein